MKLAQKLIYPVSALLLISASNSLAAGYSTGSTSVSGLANSYAGSVTGIHDVSDTFFNPAITAGKEGQAVLGLHYVSLDIDTVGSSSSFSGGSAGGGDSRDGGSDNLIPNLYFTSPINDKTNFNLAITSPFGLATEYNDTWAGKYRAVDSEITTININPSVSREIMNGLSVGVGLSAQYYKAKLTNYAAVFSGAATSFAKMHASDWGYGYNLGMSYKTPDDKLKLGIGYRSKIDHKLSGRAQAPSFSLYSDVEALVSTPESLTGGIAYEATSNIELAYDVTWTRWSRFRNLVVRDISGGALGQTANFNWRDSVMHSIGANFDANNNTVIRTGLAYEKDATTDNNREPRVPGGNRIWASLGLTHKMGDGWAVDATYMHQFYRSANINITDNSAESTTLSGKYRTKVDAIAFAIKKDF